MFFTGYHSLLDLDLMLKISEAEVMISDEGFTQRSGAGQVKIQSLGFVIVRGDCMGVKVYVCVEVAGP